MAKLFLTSFSKRKKWRVCSAVALSGWMLAQQATASVNWNGHLKYQPLVALYDDQSLYNLYTASPSVDNDADWRFNLQWLRGAWQFDGHYQLLAKTGDSVAFYHQLGPTAALAPFFPSDQRRLMDLTNYLVDDDERIVVQRLDRAVFSWTKGQTVVKLGRQAISWGNGFLFNPMDIFNPFDPTAVDKEYKNGDDMLYAQHLFDSGDDLQLVWVGRRNADGDISTSVNSVALKYHGFWQQAEYDVLLADHYDESVAAAGVILSVGGAIVRSDIVASFTDTDQYVSLVANWNYSWIWQGKNMSGTVEYFRNGVGIADGRYTTADLAAQPELLQRLARAESFNLGRDYLAFSVTTELHPLWQFTPNLFYNLNDNSSFLQLVSSHNLAENMQLTAALALPLGEPGSEFGGVESQNPGVYWSRDGSLFMQLSWYF